MSADGKIILDLHSQTRELLKSIELLIRTTDKLMDRKKWKRDEKYLNVTHVGKTLHSNGWIPSELWRFYIRDNILSFISILIHDLESDYFEKLNEPLITTGWFDFGTGKIGGVNSNWQLWYFRFHMYFENRKDDGSWMQVNPWSEWPDDAKKYNYPFKTARTFGIPLVEVTSEQILENKIIKPLLEDIVNYTKNL